MLDAQDGIRYAAPNCGRPQRDPTTPRGDIDESHTDGNTPHGERGRIAHRRTDAARVVRARRHAAGRGLLPRHEREFRFPRATLHRERGGDGGFGAANPAGAEALPDHRAPHVLQSRVRGEAHVLPALRTRRPVVPIGALGILRRRLRLPHRPVRSLPPEHSSALLAGVHGERAVLAHGQGAGPAQGVHVPAGPRARLRQRPGRRRGPPLPDQRGLLQPREGPTLRTRGTADDLPGASRIRSRSSTKACPST